MTRLPFKMATYNGSQAPAPERVYLLTHGNKAGRPSLTPWRNSVALTFESPAAAGRGYAAATSIYHSRIYDMYLVGSVIPFLRLHELRDVLTAYEHLFTSDRYEAEQLRLRRALVAQSLMEHHRQQIKELIVSYARKILTM